MSSKQRELERDLRRRYRLWTPMFTVVVLATLASFMMGQGANAGTSVFLVRVGGTATYVGFLAVVFSVAAAAARFVAGPLVDRRGRRVVAVGGAALMVLGTLGPLLSEELVPFVLWRFLQGAGFSAATSSRTGASMRHGPHQVAKKSTSTGLSASSTFDWKSAEEITSLIALPPCGVLPYGHHCRGKPPRRAPEAPSRFHSGNERPRSGASWGPAGPGGATMASGAERPKRGRRPPWKRTSCRCRSSRWWRS